jgi:hypothetical protein
VPAQDINRSLRYSHLGLEFFGILAGVFLLGHVADGELGTAPNLAFGGLMLGFGLASWRLYSGIYGAGGVAARKRGADSGSDAGPAKSKDAGADPER